MECSMCNNTEIMKKQIRFDLKLRGGECITIKR